MWLESRDEKHPKAKRFLCNYSLSEVYFKETILLKNTVTLSSTLRKPFYFCVCTLTSFYMTINRLCTFTQATYFGFNYSFVIVSQGSQKLKDAKGPLHREGETQQAKSKKKVGLVEWLPPLLMLICNSADKLLFIWLIYLFFIKMNFHKWDM